MDWSIIFNFCVIILVCITKVWSDHNKQLLQKEVEYKQDERILYSKLTGYSGDNITIGSKIEAVDILLGTNGPARLEYKCVREPESSVEASPFSKINIVRGVGETPEPSEYFVYITRELWQCDDNLESGQLKRFYRIVNELISIKEIREIKYYDGVQVASVNYLGDGRRAKIREIRYVWDHTDSSPPSRPPGTTLKYMGRLLLLHKDQTKYNIPHLITHLIQPKQVDYDKEMTEVSLRPAGESIRTTEIETAAEKSLRIGSSWIRASDETFNSGTFVCVKAQGMHPLPPRFSPECYQKNDVTDSEIKIYSKITQKDFSKIFTLARSEVWLCKPESETTGTQAHFYRVVNEVIGRVSIKNLEYDDGIVALSSIKIPNGKTVRFTEISYFSTETGERRKHDVRLKLVHNQQINSKLDESPNVFIDLSYTLTPTSVYRTLLNTEGYDLRIGSKPTEYIATGINVTCSKRETTYIGLFDTIFKVKVNEDNLFHTMDLIPNKEPNNYYKSRESSRKVWLCKNNNNQASTFYRVVNELEVLVPVREIETFDGIEILEENVDENTKILKITELKYVTINKKDVVKFGGFIRFSNNLDYGLAGTENPYRVRRSEEETTQWLGHVRESYLPLKDFKVMSLEYNSITISGKNNHMKLTVQPQNTFGSETHYVDCKLQKNHPQELFPYFEILSSSSGTAVVPMTNSKDSHLLYFEDVSNEVWLCKNIKEKYEFLRVVTKERLKKSNDISNNIGEIQFSKRDKVWFEMVNDQYEVKIKEIRYWDEKSSNSVVDYGGYLVFEETDRSGNWKSGTEIIARISKLDSRKRLKLKPEEINYILDRNVMNFYVVPRTTEEGDSSSVSSLVIGSKWIKKFPGSRSTIANCVKILETVFSGESSLSHQEQQYRTKITKYQTETGNEDLFQNYFNLLKITAWTCTSDGKTFMRVVNQFSTKPDGINTVQRIFYYDGVTFLKGEKSNKRNYEIFEVKYLDSSSNDVLKFEGKLKLTDGEEKKLKPIRIPDSEKLYKKGSQYNLLKEKEIYKTYVGEDGLILEIGEQYGVETSRLMDCKESTNTKKGEYPPKMMIVKYSQKSVERFRVNYKMYFDVTAEKYWKCEDGFLRDIIRVERKLRLKSDKNLNIVYHLYGVNVNVEDSVYIEEIKYIVQENVVVEVSGLVSLTPIHDGVKGGKGNGKSQAGEEMDNTFRDFNYILDTKIINFKSICLTGDVLEVGTEFLETVNQDGPMTCQKVNNHEYLDSWATKISAITFKQGGGGVAWSLINNKYYFHNIEQELWECKNDKESKFYRVVNRLTTSKPISTIYYYDGVSVEIQEISGTKIQQITEVKFSDDKNSGVFKKYVGELQLLIETDVVVDQLFPEETKKLPWTVSRMFRSWKLNFLMTYAIIRNKEANPNIFTTEAIKDVQAYSEREFETKIITSNIQSGHRVLKIGTHWEQELQPTSEQIKCSLDDLSVMYGFRYIPRVIEYIDDNAYLLGDEEFDEIFKLNSVEVWLCNNEVHRIIRVVSSFEGKVPMLLAVRYPDGVKMEISNEPSGASLNVTEIIYINALNSKVLKYDGEVQLLKEKTGETQPKRKYLSRIFSCRGKSCQTLD